MRSKWKQRPFKFMNRVWRKLIYKRDNWKCQYPGCGQGIWSFPFRRIEAHHIRPWSRYPQLRFCLNNGITLCSGHHTIITGHEPEFFDLFDKILKERGELCSTAQQARLKAQMRRLLYRRNVYTATGRSRRRRS